MWTHFLYGVVGVLFYLAWVLTLPLGWLGLGATIAAGLVCGGVVSREILRSPLARLEWSAAQGWLCRPCAEAGVKELQACLPHVVLDLQRVMLLRVAVPGGAGYWVWMSRGHAQQWHRLRCALYGTCPP